ncbi:MAG: penicillin acylase family protein [Chitinophagales bacterium]|nr:penicillin acylase family protein [Chitinophagales bacterium]
MEYIMARVKSNFTISIYVVLIAWLIVLPQHIYAQSFTPTEIAQWEKQAKSVKITRDIHGIPHIYGKTDADVVFGLMYAQCEDDYKRIEMNYIEKLGRMAEVKGKAYLHDDLLIRMVIDSADAIQDYMRAPKWMQKLCQAFADGMNYYLYKHPDNQSALLHRYEPWFPLLWTDGSIGAINTADVTAEELGAFYSQKDDLLSYKSVSKQDVATEENLDGSNGFAIAPSKTASKNSMLYINPHVTIYFRPEVHMVSKEGLNAYGAVTWGQFFVYQGFNEFCGWMHTSSYVDAADLYIEKIIKKDGTYFYLYDDAYLPLIEKVIHLRYKDGDDIKSKSIKTFYTHHGPIMTKRNGQYLSVKQDNRLMEGLQQCWDRTKAKTFQDFMNSLELKGNISNNTVYADRDGNIAYWHGNRIPVRDTTLDWSQPVDGSTSKTDWKGYHSMSEIVHKINPPNGWLQNCNSTPFTCAGNYSPQRRQYPKYMAPDGENFRGKNAVRVLGEIQTFDLDQVIQAGYDTRMAAFEVLIPKLITAYFDFARNGNAVSLALTDAITLFYNWDYRCDAQSIETTLAIEWGERLLSYINTIDIQYEMSMMDFVTKTEYFASENNTLTMIQTMEATLQDLVERYGTWMIKWGEINRFQRISTDMDNRFDDTLPSIPVGFGSSAWGTLPSFVSRRYSGTQKRYGYGGNSFVCAVEFGKKIKAKALLAGGQSGDESSPHFFDQGASYAQGKFRDVFFYPKDIRKHAKKTYRPGIK